MSAIHTKKRDLQPETVQVAKRQAERLAELFSERGVTLKRSEALEAVARLHGARDWNTFRAGLGSEASAAIPAPSMGVVRQLLALDQRDPALCARRLITLAGPGPDLSGMWGSRSAKMLDALLPILFSKAGDEGRGPTLEELRRAMTLEGALDLYDWYEGQRRRDVRLYALRVFLSVIPGFDFAAWRQTRTFDPKTSGQYRFTGAPWAKLIDDLMSGEVRIPVRPDLARA
jgi:hypothetical protein